MVDVVIESNVQTENQDIEKQIVRLERDLGRSQARLEKAKAEFEKRALRNEPRHKLQIEVNAQEATIAILSGKLSELKHVQVEQQRLREKQEARAAVQDANVIKHEIDRVVAESEQRTYDALLDLLVFLRRAKRKTGELRAKLNSIAARGGEHIPDLWPSRWEQVDVDFSTFVHSIWYDSDASGFSANAGHEAERREATETDVTDAWWTIEKNRH